MVEVEHQFATRTLRLVHTVISTLLQPLHDRTWAAQRQHQDDDVAVTNTSATMAALPQHLTDQSLSEQPSQSAVMTVAAAAARTTGGKT
jgi:hypothetical protein